MSADRSDSRNEESREILLALKSALELKHAS